MSGGDQIRVPAPVDARRRAAATPVRRTTRRAIDDSLLEPSGLLEGETAVRSPAAGNATRIRSSDAVVSRSPDVSTAGSSRIQRAPIQRDTSDTIRRAGVWDWMWGGAKTASEGMDTGSATMEAVDETHQADTGIGESALLTEGTMKTGSDSMGAIGGLIGGSKDIGEGVSSMREEGVGVGSALKVVGGASGVLGAINKGGAVIGGEDADKIIQATIGMGGEEIAGWLDFVSGGTKALSGAYLTGTAQLQYNRAKAIESKSRVAEVKTAAAGLMRIINERWWLGMWDVGLGTMDMAASYSIPGYTAAGKVTGAASKMMGGDLLWGALSWFSGGSVRTNDQVDDQIDETIQTLSSGATALATSALRNNDSEHLKQLYLLAKDAAPDFADRLSKAVMSLPNKEFSTKKRALKGVVWG